MMIARKKILTSAIKASIVGSIMAASFASPSFAQDPYQMNMDYGNGSGSNYGSGYSDSGSSSQKNPNVREVLIDPDVKTPLKLDDLDYELMLYEDEVFEIDAKKRAIMKYLYENDQLEEFRELMQEELRKQSLDASKKEYSKLRPGEIKLLRDYRQRIRQAENAPLKEVEQLIRTKTVPLDSNEPLTVYVSANNQSSLVFFDSAGNPWPISGTPIYNKDAFSAFKTGEKEHIVVFNITKEFSESNAMINLKGLDIPIPIKLVGTESKVDARLKARVPRMGPMMSSQPEIYTQVSPEASPEMLDMLNGEHVKDSLAYDIVTRDSSRHLGRAYYRDGEIYVRTPHELLLPIPTQASKLLSGYRTFIAPARQDLLLLVGGKQIEARLTEALELDMTPQKTIFEAGN